MNAVKTVRNIEDLLSSNLENGEKITGCEVSILTSPGENYGSIVLRMLITIDNQITGKQRILDGVGKIIPESKRVQEMCNTQVTFRNEHKFYLSIVPILDKFLRSKRVSTGVDFTAPFLGGRLNLNNNEEVDSDAIVLMQNLKSLGYTTGKKSQGLDYQTCRVVIDSLAKFHAVALALRLQDPKCFEEKLKPYFSEYIPEEKFLETVKLNLVYTLQNNGFTEEEIAKVSAAMDRDCHKKEITEIWGTMIHYDTWTNNLMVKYTQDNPVHCILVDFQDFDYGSPLNDLMFFLFTSTQDNVLETNLDDLLLYYYDSFIQNLANLDVDAKHYTKESFEKEVQSAVKCYEYCHGMWMLVPIMQEELTSMESLDGEKMTGIMNWNEKLIEKIVLITRLALGRNWL